jgi:hypothetical protein
VSHRTAAVDEDSDLPTDLETEFREFASELVADDALDRNAASGESFQSANLTGLETAGVAVDPDGATSLDGMPYPI